MAWRYNTGLFFLVTVLIMWVTYAEITQGIFEDYKHPFVMTYLGTSLFIFYLPVALITSRLCLLLKYLSGRFRKSAENVNKSTAGLDDPVEFDGVQEVFEIEHRGSSSGKGDGTDLKSQEEGTALDSQQINDVNVLIKQNTKLSTKGTATLGLLLAPIFFLNTYFTNAALARTNVASTTVLYSTSALFTLFIGAALRQDSINAAKVVSVVMSMVGVAMTIIGKTWSTDGSQLSKSFHGKHSLVGDLFAILSAITYALFTVLLKKFTGEEGEKVDMQKLYGYIGLFSLVSLWWLIWPLTAMGIEPEFAIPHSAKMGGILFANCFVGNFLCDYFWALGVVWTTPLVAALGMSLTIPLAMLADMVVHGQHYSAIYIIGSAQVFVGFVTVNFSDWFSQKLKLLSSFNLIG